MPNRPYLGRMVDDAIAMFKPHVSGTEGAVSANNPYAAEAGLEILKAGGNAFDAACAISLVLGVVEPYHSGIGGGCFHVFYDKRPTPSMRWMPVAWPPRTPIRTCS